MSSLHLKILGLGVRGARQIVSAISTVRTTIAKSKSEKAVPANKETRPMSDLGNPRTIRNTGARPQRKWWGESITIWGALITAAATVIPLAGRLAGLEISADFIHEVGQDLVMAMQLVAGLIGTLMALYGRARATQPLERRSINLML